MTQDEIIRMAREAGALIFQSNFCDSSFDFNSEQLERFYQLAFAAGAAHEKKFWVKQIEVECNEAVIDEREACAKVCDDLIGTRAYAMQCAAAIRARSDKE